MAWTRFGKKKDMPGGLWIKCENCGAMLFRKEFEAHHRVCGSCSYHFTLPGRERVALTADVGSFKEIYANLRAEDRLGFIDRIPYKDKLKASQSKSGEKDALIVGTCTIEGRAAVLAVMNFAFMGGSMGVVVGEKVTLAVEKAIELDLPLIIFSCSGGARMHEGAISLMQMAKTCGALSRLEKAGGFSISVMTHPTTGGVTASFASVCDILLAEPHSLIGFAGPRVIATTIKKELPKGFQRAEFLLEKGQIDRIVSRQDMRHEIAKLLAYARDEEPLPQESKEAGTEAVAGKASEAAPPEAKPKTRAKAKKVRRKGSAEKSGKKGGSPKES